MFRAHLMWMLALYLIHPISILMALVCHRRGKESMMPNTGFYSAPGQTLVE